MLKKIAKQKNLKMCNFLFHLVENHLIALIISNWIFSPSCLFLLTIATDVCDIHDYCLFILLSKSFFLVFLIFILIENYFEKPFSSWMLFKYHFHDVSFILQNMIGKCMQIFSIEHVWNFFLKYIIFSHFDFKGKYFLKCFWKNWDFNWVV
jgi:hypothetical protein